MPIGMNLTLVKKRMQHKASHRLLEHIQDNGQKILITVNRGTKEMSFQPELQGKQL